MISDLIASRYAKALMRLVKNEAHAEEVLEGLDVIKGLYSLEDSCEILKSPVMPKNLKKQLLFYGWEQTSKDSELKKFLGTLVDSGRVDLLPDIVKLFSLYVLELKGVKEVKVVSALKLTSDEQEGIKKSLASELQQEIQIENVVDPQILGGLVVNIGNKKLDLSLKTKLNKMTSQLKL